MDSQNLKAFIAVADHLSFSVAAEQLCLTQPAISKRIAQLESSIGTRLFDRIGRQVQLTEAGRVLLPRARAIWRDMEEAAMMVAHLGESVSGRLRIGTSHHIGLHRLPDVLRRYSRAYPAVQLDLHFIDSEEAWEGVLHGDLELGIVTLPPEPDSRAMTQVVWEDPLVFMAAPDHPLAQKTRIPLKLLTQYSAILPSPTTFTRRIVERLFARQDLRLDISMSTNYLETIRMMVAIGLGWSVLPATMLADDLINLPVSAPLPVRHLGYVMHPSRSLSNAATRFLDFLTDNPSHL